jgi:hypothetical protein
LSMKMVETTSYEKLLRGVQGGGFLEKEDGDGALLFYFFLI